MGELSNPCERAAAEAMAGLIGRMAAGEEHALADFYDSTQGKANALARRIVRDPGAAEEVVEDAFYQAWRDADRYDASRGSPLAWLLTIVRSRALDFLRRRAAAFPAELCADPEQLAEAENSGGGVPDPSEILEALERANAVHAALAELAPSARQLVALAFFRGLSHQEIATASGLPLGTVKTTLHRACLRMRARINRQGAPS